MNNRNKEITEYFSKYDTVKVKQLETIRTLIHECIPGIEEKMWTKVPCFYTNKVSIVIRVFDDHINFITNNVVQYKDELLGYKITPKGMLQIFDHQEIPFDTMRKIIGAGK